MPTILTLPWRWTRQPRPDHAVLFASRFDSTGPTAGLRLFVGGLRLRGAVLGSPGALGVSLHAYPLKGRYYTLSMWSDEDSLLAFAHGPAHRAVVRGVAELGPVSGVLVSRDAETRRPSWRQVRRWMATVEPGPYQRRANVS